MNNLVRSLIRAFEAHVLITNLSLPDFWVTSGHHEHFIGTMNHTNWSIHALDFFQTHDYVMTFGYKAAWPRGMWNVHKS